ncbi:MAG: DNA polymerase I [Candidatus Krumholzibacteriota bacterium]|nr:DNA polymerase I [Candidatus Krumholzibacteriota bacterium]
MVFIIIDGHALAYRSYYAFIRNPLVNSKGQNTSAVYGFTRVILQILKKFEPAYLACVFDSPEETQRHRDFEEYKAQRAEMPEDMSEQLPVIFDLLAALGIPVLASPGYEADDIIATLAREAAQEGVEVKIVSGDKDLFQILSDKIHLIRQSRGTNLEDEIGPSYLRERFGLRPDQVVDWLSLMGDSADNIPGVRGIGEKGALKLLQQFGSLDRMLESIDQVEPEHLRKKLAEGKEDAHFSRSLVQLVEVPLEEDFRNLTPGQPDEKRLNALLLDLEFSQIAKELALEGGGDKGKRERKRYRLVDRSNLQELAGVLNQAGEFALDVETTSLDTQSASLVGISLATEEGSAWYVPVSAPAGGIKGGLFGEDGEERMGIELDEIRKILGPVLRSEKTGKIGHNIKFDLKVLENHGLPVNNVTFDTMIASYCLDPSRRSHSLDNLSGEIFQHRMVSYNELFDKKDRIRDIRAVPVEKLCDYACEDADYTLRLKHKFEPELKESGSETLFRDIEIPLCFVLKRMEQTGVALDIARLKALSGELSAELDRLTGAIHQEAGEVFNINSNKQLQHILFEKLGLPAARKTKTGYSTDVRVLTELAVDYPVAALLLEYRQLAKLLSTYIETLPALVSPVTGRIHTSFNQTVTATGRLSSSDPNLQNIPIRSELGRKIRGAFVPSPGNILLDADYSQIELRIMAHLSGDPELLRAFREDSDIHSRTAARIYEVPPEEVTAAMRAAAKTINFGVMYGQGPRALSQQLRIPLEEARKFIDEYFEKYPGIRDFMENSKESARRNEYAETILGRRRPLPDINSSNGRFRGLAERIAVNMPIQGTAADLIKVAMNNIDRAIIKRELRSRMILQVHDELLFDAPREELELMTGLVRKLMESAIKLEVPLKIDIGTGRNWLEAH